MNKSINKSLLAGILCGGVLSGFAFAASAQTVTVSDDEGAVQVAESQQRADAEDRVSDRTCLRSTGSRITALQNEQAKKAGKPARDCVAASGRSYSREDLDRTGEVDIADALRRLDPAIR